MYAPNRDIITQQLTPSTCLVTVGYKFYHWLALGEEVLVKAISGSLSRDRSNMPSCATAEARSRTLHETQPGCHGLTSRGPF